MAYKYLSVSPSLNVTPKQTFVNDFQASLDVLFPIASDFWTIQEEETFASGVFQDVDVRIVTHVISSITGKLLGDDYRLILFPDLGHAVGLGYMYYFDSNYFITINSEKIKNLAAGATVKRCNNTLRWIDEEGAYHSIPCAIDYLVTRNKDIANTQALTVEPEGLIDVVCQFNNETNLIKPNQRFLFGNANNWTAYKQMGGGVNNFNNLTTLDNMSVGYMHLSMKTDYVSDNDDLTNGIAYEDKMEYTLTLGQTGITGIQGATGIQLPAMVELNGSSVERDIVWASSNISRATVGATGNPGIIALGTTGTAIITGALAGNTGVHAHANVTVVSAATDIYQVVIDPDTNYILEGETESYDVYLYQNGVKLAYIPFTASLNAGTVPSDHYAFGYTGMPGNTFDVENKEMYLDDHLTITYTAGATGGIPPTSQTKVQEINLRGSW
jgi:hypothetical protein